MAGLLNNAKLQTEEIKDLLIASQSLSNEANISIMTNDMNELE